MSRLHTSFVLGFHGCEKDFGIRVINGEEKLKPGDSKFDWLGTGIYFWESDPKRAREWANKKAERGHVNEPFVIGAVIDLGNCLDLLVRDDVALVQDAYDSFKEVQTKAGLKMPENKKAPKDQSEDRVMRYLDCAVINHLHSIIASSSGRIEPYDTVRGVFREGGPMFSGSALYDKNHAQIAVCNSRCIKGVFLPID